MKVLAVLGSHRKKGNTTKIAKIIEENLKRLDQVEFEYLYLVDFNLSDCKGCITCIEKGEDKCPLKDDRPLIQQKIAEADGIIFISPVYTFHITTLMKKFFDRFTFLIHRPRFFDKKAMTISLAGGPDKAAREYMARNARAWGMDVVLTHSTIAHQDALRPKFKKKNTKGLSIASKKFYKTLKKNKKHKPSIGNLMWFKMWQLNALVNKEDIPADYDYWYSNGWFTKDYYYDVKINFLKKLISKGLFGVAKVFMHRVYINY